jgi:hypothetical protein
MNTSETREALRDLIDLWRRLEGITRQAMPNATEEERAEATAAAARRILRLP